MLLVKPLETEVDDPAPIAVMRLMDELDDALTLAFFSYNLRAEVEEALDAALLRDRLATTPVLAGTLAA